MFALFGLRPVNNSQIQLYAGVSSRNPTIEFKESKIFNSAIEFSNGEGALTESLLGRFAVRVYNGSEINNSTFTIIRNENFWEDDDIFRFEDSKAIKANIRLKGTKGCLSRVYVCLPIGKSNQ